MGLLGFRYGCSAVQVFNRGFHSDCWSDDEVQAPKLNLRVESETLGWPSMRIPPASTQCS